MNRKYTRMWAAMGWLTMGAAVVAPATAFAQPRDVRDSRDVRASGGELAKAVRYDDLPREVRRTLDEERGKREVLGIQRVNQNGKEFYRCTVALKSGERSIRIQPGGSLLSVEDVTQSDVAAYKQKGSADDYYRERDTREATRQSYWERINADVRATAQNPEKVNLDDIPPRVRATFAREAMGEKVDYVVRYRQDNDVIYQTNVPDAPGKVRMLQVGGDGRLMNTGEFTTGGRAVEGGGRIETLDVGDLPRGVHKALEGQYSRARVTHVDVATRRGQKIYTVQLDDAGRDRYLVVGDDGRVLSDIPDRDYSARR